MLWETENFCDRFLDIIHHSGFSCRCSLVLEPLRCRSFWGGGGGCNLEEASLGPFMLVTGSWSCCPTGPAPGPHKNRWITTLWRIALWSRMCSGSKIAAAVFCFWKTHPSNVGVTVTIKLRVVNLESTLSCFVDTIINLRHFKVYQVC